MDEFRPTNKSLLKGVEDWPYFEQDMEAVFRIQRTWEVVIGQKKRPTPPPLPTPPTPPESQSSTSREKLPELTYEQNEKYTEALEEWEGKNSSALGALIMRCGATPRSHIRKIQLVSVAWEKLTQVYGVSSISSIDATMGALTRLKSTSFNTIQDYAAAFKDCEDKLSLLDAPIPPVLSAALFRNGLDESLAPYVFNLVQQCKTSGSMLDIDTMVAALSEKQARLNDSENNKALAAKFGKQDKAKRPPRSPAGSRPPHNRNPPPTDKKDEKDNRKACPHCGKLHRKDNCWYTNPQLAPVDWIPNKEIMDQIKANKKKASAAKASTAPPAQPAANLPAEAQNEKASESNEYVGPGITRKSLRNELTDSRRINTSIPSDPKEEAVYIDTASDVHTMWDISKFQTYQKVDETLSGIDGNSLRVLGIGIVHYPSVVNGKLSIIELSNVHHVPAMHYNLLSVACLEDKGCHAVIKDGRFDIIDNEGDLVLTGSRVGNSYLLDLQYTETLHALRSSKKPLANHASWDEWHRRLGHLGMQDVKKLANIASGIDTKMADKLQKAVPPHKYCEDCAITKMTKIHNRIPHRQDPTKRELVPGAKISSDIAGGGQIKLTKGGHRYCASFICEATDMVWIYMMKFKTDLPIILRDHLTLMKTQGRPVSRFTSDNEPIYASKEVQAILKSFGIKWEPAEPYTPNQNAIAERTFRTLFGRVRAVLRDAGFSQSYWGEAISYIVYTKNRSPSSVDPSTTPYEAWTGKKTDVSNFRPFGCVAYVYDTDPTKKKLDNRATKAKFLGYGFCNNQYRFRDVQRKRTFESSWVRWELDSYVDSKDTGAGEEESFNKNDSWEFFTANSSTRRQKSPTAERQNSPTATADPIKQGEQATDVTAIADVNSTGNSNANNSNNSDENDSNNPDVTNIDSDESDSSSNNDDSSNNDVFETPAQTPAPEQTPEETEGPQAATTPQQPEANADLNIRQTRTRVQARPDYRQLHRRGFAARFAAKSCKADVGPAPPVPANIHEALSGPDKEKWMAAFQDELTSLEKMVTWDTPAPVPKGRKALPGRWVLAYKLDPNGEIARYKARWVVKGFRQIEGLDYNETYSSTVKGTAVRILMALCAKYDYEMEQSDVITAFLESSLTEEVWVEQPHGFTNGNPTDACRLRRALYGLKQSPREWYETIRQFMESLGYTRLVKDHSIFTSDNGMIVAFYVDDILMCGPNKAVIAEFKQNLDQRFRMKHLSDVNWYLGMAIIRDRPNRTIYINQTSYAKRVIAQADMETCHPVASPMDKGNDLVRAPDKYVADRTEAEVYRALVGELQWLSTMTRPDLAFAVGKSGRFSINPTSEHLNSVKRIIKYLAGTTEVGLRYGPGDVTKGVNPEGNLLGWTDSSWSDDRDTSHATSGYVFQLWNGPISWSSKLQTLCTDSTAEAEYVAECNAAKESLFLSELLQGIGYDEKDIKPIKLMGDNQAAIKLAANPINHQRTKHIRNKFHFVREMVSETGELTLQYCNTADMIADGMTKALAPNDFRPFRDKLGLATSVIGGEPGQ